MNRQQRRQAKRTARRKISKRGLASDPRLLIVRKAHEAGRHEEAKAGYDKILAENPDDAEALHFSGLLQYQLGNVEAAESLLGKAIRIRPGVPMFHANLANIFQFVGKLDAAEREYRKALYLDPRYASAHRHYSVLLIGQQRLDEAEASARQADAVEPENPATLNLLASICRQRGELSTAETYLRRALDIDPEFEKAYSNLIFLSDFKLDFSFREQQSLRRDWAARYADPLLPTSLAYQNVPDPEKKLRIGYVSGDFRAHSAQLAFGGVIFERDRRAFEAFCYMTSANSDTITERFKASADAWCPCWGLDEAGLAEKIRADGIDILVDLSGHSEGGKLLAFARKPAPVQITGWGHCTGTGLSAMDYFFADALIVPPEDAEQFAEEVVNLSCCLGFMAPSETPNIEPPPVLNNGYVTFGCFNRVEKLSTETLYAWSEILRGVDDSRLLLKHVALEERGVVDDLKKLLSDHRIEPSRVNFMGRTKWFDHLSAFERVDIALDPFPNNGGVTTLETLWMGVPLVTLYGSAPASRIAASIVSASGNEDWVAASVSKYVETASCLAADPEALQAIRWSLRPALRERPIGNPKLYAMEVEAQFRRLWRNWCDRGRGGNQSIENITETQGQIREVPGQERETLADLMQSAMRLHESGEFGKAIVLYDRALSVAPDDPEIFHMKGVALAQGGDIDKGVSLIQRAIEINGDSVDYHNNLGVFLREAGRLDEAEAALRQAIQIAPEHSPAYGNLAGVLENAGRFDEAADLCRSALWRDPDSAELHHTLGLQLHHSGDLDAAATSLGRAAELAPKSPEIRNNFGNVLMEIGAYESAESSFREAVRLRPDYAAAWQNLGSLLVEMWRPDEAICCFDKAIARDPNFIQAHVNHAAALNLGERHTEAVVSARRAISIEPQTAEAYNNLGVALRALGDHSGAEAAYRRVVEIDPHNAKGHSNLIFALDFNNAYDIRDHQAERKRWNLLHSSPLSGEMKDHCNNPDPHRKLRIGYVSADFRRHSATNGFGPMIHHFDPDHFDVVCYASNVLEDDITMSMRDSATEWRQCERLSHSQLAETIRGDAIDILVDLSGHSAGNRLLVFARKPAPVQVHAWGFATGTGLATMDYFLTDPVVVSERDRKLYAEDIRYLPSHLPYLPPRPCPNPKPGPYENSGIFTFGSFNRLEKFSDGALEIWSEILKREREACLVLKSQALDREGAIYDLELRLEAAGIERSRVQLLGSDPQPEHLAKHSLIDLMLDSFPHAGGISTADALWMGVPVVSLKGKTVASRIGASALHAAGLNELIASNTAEYIEIATGMARSPVRLAKLRAGMRKRISSSPMGDIKRYVRAVETVYREIWREWCDSRSSD